jgi:hypothetical protein
VAGDATSLRRALVDLAVGDATTAAAAAGAVRAAGRQDELVRLAWAWRVVPRLQEQVAAGASLGSEADARLGQMALAAAAESTLYFHRAGTAFDALRAARVRACAFKGVASIATLYGTPSARMIRDVDVVIDPAQVETAVEALRAIGFELTDPIGAEGMAAWIDALRSPMVNLRNLFVSLRNDEGFEVDLHVRFGHAPPPRMTPASLLARGHTAEAAGVALPVLSSVDLILLTVYHSLKDLMALTSAARDLADLAAWWHRGREHWSLDELVPASTAARLDMPLLAFWLLLARAEPDGPTGAGVERLDAAVDHATRRDARRMVQLFDHLLDAGRISRGVLSTLTPQRGRRYLAARRRVDATAATVPTRGSRRIAGLVRVGREAVSVRRLAGYRALARAQRGYR